MHYEMNGGGVLGKVFRFIHLFIYLKYLTTYYYTRKVGGEGGNGAGACFFFVSIARVMGCDEI